MKEVLLPLSHPALCFCTGFTNFFRLIEALLWDSCELFQSFRVIIISISRQSTCIIYASFFCASHVSRDSVLPGYVDCCHYIHDYRLIACGNVIEFSRGTRDQVN